MSKRIEFIDVAKGIATLCVIVGHLYYTPQPLLIWVYTFHIPLFFFLSGFVLNCQKYDGFIDFVKDKCKKSLLPYFYLSLVIWVFSECINQPIAHLGIASLKRFIGIFICAKDTPYYLNLWFVVSLFFAQMVVYLLTRLHDDRKMVVGLIALFGIGYYISIIYRPGWIFASDTVPIASVFVGMGYLARKYYDVLKSYCHVWMLIVMALMNVVCGFLNLNGIPRVDLFYQNIGNPILYLLSATSGIIMVCIFSQYIHRFKLFQYIGMNSLIFYALHRPVFVPRVYRFVDGLIAQQVPLFSYKLIQTSVAVLLICIGLVIVTEFIHRFCPFIIGKTKRGV